ncbi:Capsular polysaccharide biosynthesis protein [Evansella caseinilytica]|uniref:Capsular polysaccharide biosynthesis protein n=1 Tax=Evansella caseinilytica TaxID=1503961 RepID=A0A1H3T8C4_9BACI|nr:Wzz/FepE/Etk N-terminal domain-containing protein [Evansella caseinilytica]SDZ46464.1 Capsular polysaccharide biosynthesis protein [Evansella caseinilytica]
MEETISLKEIVTTLRKRISLIILLTALAVAATAIVSYFMLTPMYQASTQLLVNQSKEEGQVYTQNDVRTNIELINTYNVIITSPRILEQVLDEMQLERSYGTLRDQITVGSERDSQVVYIRVEDESPAMAVQIANTIATVFQEDIVDIMNVDNVSLLSLAELSDDPTPISPNPKLNMAIAFVVGLMAGVGLAFLLEFLDNTIKTEEQVEEKLGIPVIGMIAKMNTSNVNMNMAKHANRTRKGREHIGA